MEVPTANLYSGFVFYNHSLASAYTITVAMCIIFYTYCHTKAFPSEQMKVF